MISTDDPEAIEFTTDEEVVNYESDESEVDESGLQLETRFSIVCDAVSRDRSHKDEATGQFLGLLYDCLAEHSLGKAGDAPLDDRVVNVLHEMKPLRNYFLQFVNLACAHKQNSKIHVAIRSFLGKSLTYKNAPRDVIHFNHLWCDHYRFFLRELYLSVIALLIKHELYDEVNTYLDADYLFATSRGAQKTTFLSFDSYIKTLDEFRMRRIRKTCLSAAADYLRERSDLDFLSFDDVMQADFILCMRGLLHHSEALTRWFPRTLVHAGTYEITGFQLFSSARENKAFGPIAAILKVKNHKVLKARFAQVSGQCRLDEWKFGGVAIPFERYLALS